METLEGLAHRIDATQDLQSLVRSMKTLSAVSIRQYEKAEESLRLFRRTIEFGLQAVLKQHPVFARPEGAGKLPMALVVFGSDRGLCGGFNESAAELACLHIERSRDVADRIHVLAIGSQVAARMEAIGRKPDEVMGLPGSVQGLAETCENILIRIDELRQSDEIERVGGIYNQRDDSGEIWPHAHILLPVPLRHLNDLGKRKWPSCSLPTYSVETAQLFSWLIRQHLFADLYHAGLSSMASENAARLASMQHAERNIGDQLETMTGDYRRMRQDVITTELMDIVGGYEILRTPRDM